MPNDNQAMVKLQSVTGIERRGAARVFVKLPVVLEGGEGITRDVNSTGVYFESDLAYVLDSEFSFSVKLQNPKFRNMIWNCKGQVVRVEQHDGKLAIAARIVQSSLSVA